MLSSEAEVFQNISEQVQDSRKLSQLRRDLARSKGCASNCMQERGELLQAAPLLAHHARSWNREMRRSIKQLEVAQTVAELYPGSRNGVAMPNWNNEKAALTSHYRNCRLKTEDELSVINSQLRQNQERLRALSAREMAATEQARQAANKLHFLQNKTEETREKLFHTVFAAGW
eukprot:CAMPEP_0117655572 /NCGR_PEP_ID=MMETSP0804-20121206/4349_1 /TAXON_ID=1074897 /ORGANISM="Tetraselmis astigmatica, Strain CCMP880" /LENGTH=173 /DNA_ID=CAMNT_0005461929 /DNA_START=71 /DNA_END=589 /DNA_ORIENTATION=+